MAVPVGQRRVHPVRTVRQRVSGDRPAEVHFFADRQALRAWFESHHAGAEELWIGYWKKTAARGGVTYAEAVEEALCFGWVDSRLRSLGPESYAHRYTPRRETSHWSTSSITAARALIGAGRMRPSGLRAFERRPAARQTTRRRRDSGAA